MEVKVLFKDGGSFGRLKPQFSANGENLYIAWKNDIVEYNTRTGKQSATFKGMSDLIVGFSIHYSSTYECITACSSSGQVITWKASTHFKLINKNLEKGTIARFHVIPSENEETKVFISYENNEKIEFALVDLHSDDTTNYNISIKSSPYHLDICRNEYFVVAQRKTFYIAKFKGSLPIKHTIDNNRNITCIACHPEYDVLLTGDTKGRVLVWQNLFTERPTKAIFHWHTLEVMSVAFSASGSYFYSGGRESVLVRWNIDNNYERKFLPRISAEISSITVSPDNMFIAVATRDNAIRIVDPRFATISQIQHLSIGDKSILSFDPRTKSLVMNGPVGHIQFYAPHEASLLYSLDIVQQNKITDERGKRIDNTEIAHVAISKSGLWMATVEERRDIKILEELRLKFWNFNVENQNFQLNTSVELPHAKIWSIEFQPTSNEDELKCVTIGDDQKFKVWKLIDATTVYTKGNSWGCLYTGYYRDMPCRGLSFSADGSLMAIGFNQITTTWLPDSCEIKCSLSPANCKEPILDLKFGSRDQCHLLVTVTKERLSVWNLLTLSMVWTVPARTHQLIADSITTNMAIITTNNKVFVFSPSSSEHIYASSTTLKDHTVVSAAFAPTKNSFNAHMKWHQRSPIYFINHNRQLLCLGSDEEMTETIEFNDEKQSVYNNMIPRVKTDHTQNLQPFQHMFSRDFADKNIKKFLEEPIQTMIPMRFTCGGLLRSMVLLKS